MERPDLIVVDPPRMGLGAEMTALLSAVAAPAIVYVSCDPATLARDLRALRVPDTRSNLSRSPTCFRRHSTWRQSCICGEPDRLNTRTPSRSARHAIGTDYHRARSVTSCLRKAERGPTVPCRMVICSRNRPCAGCVAAAELGAGCAGPVSGAVRHCGVSRAAHRVAASCGAVVFAGRVVRGDGAASSARARCRPHCQTAFCAQLKAP